MRRRIFLKSSVAAASAPLIAPHLALADTIDPNRLNSDLTPLGADRAGSASGNVPAWTGGVSAPPPGWDPAHPSDLYSSDPVKFVVTADNMAQYADMLSDGQMQMLKRYGSQGYKLIVYPTHRSMAAPQSVYDAAFKNVTQAQPASSGIIYGFTGAVGAPPFPILSSDPAIAGAQCMWNHQMRWQGYSLYEYEAEVIVGNNQRSLTGGDQYWAISPYYKPGITAAEYDKNPLYIVEYISEIAPANEVGGKVMAFYSSNLNVRPDQSYEYLTGLGRVRQLPGTEYDIPVAQEADAINYDEIWLFQGALDRFNWKLIGKKEMIVPYNQHAMLWGLKNMNDAMGLQTINQDLVRYEIHRCWVVEAHLAPGKRHSMPVRRFYIDEDTWTIVLSDGYDDQNNYYRFGQMFLEVQPQLPGTVAVGNSIANLQSRFYTYEQPFHQAPRPLGNGPTSYAPLPMSMFTPEAMANSGGL
jgi:hypothetical protein